MKEVVVSVSRVTDIIGEISSATSEQSSGIALVNSAVTDLDRMTQQNAALVEEGAAASESLMDQARKLLDAINQFRVAGSTDAAEILPSRTVASIAKKALPAPRVAAPPALPARAPVNAARIDATARIEAAVRTEPEARFQPLARSEPLTRSEPARRPSVLAQAPAGGSVRPSALNTSKINASKSAVKAADDDWEEF